MNFIYCCCCCGACTCISYSAHVETRGQPAIVMSFLPPFGSQASQAVSVGGRRTESFHQPQMNLFLSSVQRGGLGSGFCSVVPVTWTVLRLKGRDTRNNRKDESGLEKFKQNQSELKGPRAKTSLVGTNTCPCPALLCESVVGCGLCEEQPPFSCLELVVPIRP